MRDVWGGLLVFPAKRPAPLKLSRCRKVRLLFVAGQAVAAALACSAAFAAMSSPQSFRVAARLGPTGTIRGRVLHVGKPIQPMEMANTEDPNYCGKTMTMLPVQVEKGGVANAVISIVNITRGKAYSFPRPVINQVRCRFLPAVVLMAPGDLEVRNSDPVSHDVQVFSRYNRSSNFTMAPGAKPVEVALMRPDTVTVACDIHKDMISYVVVAKNPYYALSQSGGAFELTGVPPGTYELKVWQEALGTSVQRVTVRAGATSNVTFKLP